MRNGNTQTFSIKSSVTDLKKKVAVMNTVNSNLIRNLKLRQLAICYSSLHLS